MTNVIFCTRVFTKKENWHRTLANGFEISVKLSFFLNTQIEDFGHFRPFCRQRCGIVTIFYGSGSDF